MRLALFEDHKIEKVLRVVTERIMTRKVKPGAISIITWPSFNLSVTFSLPHDAIVISVKTFCSIQTHPATFSITPIKQKTLWNLPIAQSANHALFQQSSQLHPEHYNQRFNRGGVHSKSTVLGMKNNY